MKTVKHSNYRVVIDVEVPWLAPNPSKEQIDEIVAAVMGDALTLHASGDGIRSRLTRAFGRERNPYEHLRGNPFEEFKLVPDLFDAAAKVADGCDDGGGLLSTTHDHERARAALKEIVARIREVRG